MLLELLADAADFWKGKGRPFVILLQGGQDPYPMVVA